MAQGKRRIVADQVPHGKQRNGRAHRTEVPVPQTLIFRGRMKSADHQTVPQAAQGQPALGGAQSRNAFSVGKIGKADNDGAELRCGLVARN